MLAGDPTKAEDRRLRRVIIRVDERKPPHHPHERAEIDGILDQLISID
jgi:hypothetical protein